MRVLGIKTTHDASVALIEDGVLQFCIEAEKMGKERYATFDSILDALNVAGDGPWDSSVVDGWKSGDYARYHEFDGIIPEKTGHRTVRNGFPSFHHIYGHVAGSYMMSPYAGTDDAYVLVWDGGLQPRLYLWETGKGARFIACLHEIYGLIYGIKGYYWGPFKDPEKQVKNGVAPEPSLKYYGGYSMPGKLMGWIGLGKVKQKYFTPLFLCYQKALAESGRKRHLAYNQDGQLEHLLCHHAQILMRDESDEDAMATFHSWLTHFTIGQLDKHTRTKLPIINTGGCALNIKLNSAIRSFFGHCWVPPVPNDSGSGIGAACAEWHYLTSQERIEWVPFCGPPLELDLTWDLGWELNESLGLEHIADVITEGEVVCFLDGPAEIGPRALGGRSLLADPRTIESKNKLNGMKRREDWRPVSPIALEADCRRWFETDIAHMDPYMIFDHGMPLSSQKKLPAVAHVDGTARLQTATRGTRVHDLLQIFKAKTGFGVLCNTSANLPGKGFFHRLSDALRWSKDNGVKTVWADGDVWKLP